MAFKRFCLAAWFSIGFSLPVLGEPNPIVYVSTLSAETPWAAIEMSSLGNASHALSEIFGGRIEAVYGETFGARLPCYVLENLTSGAFGRIKTAGCGFTHPIFGSFAGLTGKIVLQPWIEG